MNPVFETILAAFIMDAIFNNTIEEFTNFVRGFQGMISFNLNENEILDLIHSLMEISIPMGYPWHRRYVLVGKLQELVM